MRILLCTPYRQDKSVVSGGINIWGKNVLSYYSQHNEAVYVEPISYDRRYDVKENTSFLSRFIYGFRDYSTSIKETKEKIKSNTYNVLHLCSSAQLSLIKDYYILKYARKKGLKTVLHLHFGRIPELFENNNWETFLLKKVAQIANMIVVMDANSYSVLKENGFNVSYLPNPISPVILDQICSMRGSVSRIVSKVLYVGHVIPSKGVYELVKACGNISDIELHLIGTIDEDVRNELNKITKLNEASDYLKIRGAMPHEQVVQEMLSAGVFVLPSYTEGFPNVILEAMACGCPIVATDVGAIPEMLDIENGNNNGICVKPKDVEGLRGAIQKMLEDHTYAVQCGQNAQRRVNMLYSMPQIWTQLVNVWTNL